MANIAKHRDRYTIRFTSFDGTRRQLYGFTNERIAQRIGDRIDDLVIARRMGTIPEELKSWLQKLEPSIHEKLAEWGLCEPREKRWTLKNLTDSFIESRKNDPPTSMQKYLQVQSNLHQYFGSDCDLTTITPADAKLFEIWLRTEPLNKGVPYATATCARRIGCIKLIFKYGVEIGMMPASPMAALRGGEAVNPSRWQYISVEDCVRVIQTEPNLKTRVTVSLLRFCGLRGTSDMIKLTWGDVAWSHDGTPCRILIHGQKNVRHGKGTRWVQPLHPIVERALKDYHDSLHDPQPTDVLYPGMVRTTNIGIVAKKAFIRANVEVGEPYNLRRSYCSDMFEMGIDPALYELCTDHSTQVSMKHYQIMHEGRIQRGLDSIKMFPDTPTEKPGTDDAKAA
ncbi:MAG: phage integrase SAM-like domain-containing protein [Planctomycetia bacterium]|nr:phage integrase SAM-like domain-containing protein [Planctomycetia bacterium]